MVITWNKISELLPQNEEMVLVVHNGEIKSCKFLKGITKEQRELMRKGELENPTIHAYSGAEGYHYTSRSLVYAWEDEYANNLTPYCFVYNHSRIFGQDIKYWAQMPKLTDYEQS